MVGKGSIRHLCRMVERLGNGNGAIRHIVESFLNQPLEKLFEKILAEARKEAERIEEAISRAQQWARIASYSGEESDFEKAYASLSQISHRCSRAKIKKDIAEALAQVGSIDKARNEAGRIKIAYWRAEAFIAIFKQSKTFQDLERAGDASKKINSPDAKEEIQAQINALSATI